MMNYQLVGDSSVDLTDELEKSLDIQLVAFTIQVEGEDFVDKDRSQIQAMREAMNASKKAIKTSCPSPYDYQEVFNKEADGIFVITISDKLSGSYNSATLAAKDFQEENPQTRIHIFNSQSASAGETNLAYHIKSLMDQGLAFDEIVEKGERFIREMETFFILESLNNLIKNGRIRKSAGLIAKTLNIKPIMQGVKGEIELFELNRGFKKSLDKLAKAIGRIVEKTEGRTLYISQSNAEEKAEFFKKKILDLYRFDDVVVVPTGGLSSAYADDGGIVISF